MRLKLPSCYSQVLQGVAKELPKSDETNVTVAIKMVKDSATLRERIDFLTEISNMKWVFCLYILCEGGVLAACV